MKDLWSTLILIGTLEDENIACIKLLIVEIIHVWQRVHIRGMCIHVYGSNTLGENKNQENETFKQSNETQM